LLTDVETVVQLGTDRHRRKAINRGGTRRLMEKGKKIQNRNKERK
jgi:hypothetical protein